MARTSCIWDAVGMHWLLPVMLSALVSSCVPMPRQRLPELGKTRVQSLDLPAWTPLGMSVQGRPIRYRAIGSGSRSVLFIGGIHGDEIEGRVATAQLPLAFLRSPGLARQVPLHIVEDMNPDGRHAGVRANSRGVDLNRDFPASNRRKGHGLSEPESRAAHDLIRTLKPDLVIVAHSWRKRFFINYDGPGKRLAQTFSRYSGFPVVPSSNIGATPGSLGSWCGWDLGIPILTIEWQRGTPPEQAWTSTRMALLAVIRGATS